jgi:hypothetical protein
VSFSPFFPSRFFSFFLIFSFLVSSEVERFTPFPGSCSIACTPLNDHQKFPPAQIFNYKTWPCQASHRSPFAPIPNMPAFTRVHPRYSIALLVSFFICILYLFNANSGPGGFSRPYPPSSKNRPHGLLVSEQLRLSEAYYKEHLRNRQKFIERLGPTPDTIPACVVNLFLGATIIILNPGFPNPCSFPATGTHLYTLCPPLPLPYRPSLSDLCVCFFFAIGDFFLPAFPCPHRVQRVGTLGDGGKWVCGLERLIRKPKCVIYSIGQFPPPFIALLVWERADGRGVGRRVQ